MSRGPLADFFPEDRGRKSGDELTVADVLADFKRAYEAKRSLLDAQREDYEFALGKQWEDKDVRALEAIGVRALTLNKIAPNLQLLKGLESQNRSDPRAFPEGDEDQVKAEIATRLMGNAIKHSHLNFTISDAFNGGNTCGEGWIEPWIEYPYRLRPDGNVDMLGELHFKQGHHEQWYPDPDSDDYEMHSGQYLCKLTTDVRREKLISMFPDQKDAIEEIEEGAKLNVDEASMERDQTGMEIQTKGYKDQASTASWSRGGIDLLDYYYRKYVPKYFIADFQQGTMRQAKDKKQADRFVKKATEGDPNPKKPSAKVIEKLVPELWVAFVAGGMDEFLAHGPAWCFPRWKSWPAFRYCCYFSSAPLDPADRHLLIQGLTRRVKDNQREHNKRRTQELRHLNQSTNSGWIGEDGAFVDEDKWETSGSQPGVVLKHKTGMTRPERISPTPLSQGHAQLAEEHQKDMRDSLGIDRENLALQSGDLSGRAIALRQKQGMVMIQDQFDNLARTKHNIYRFVLSVLSELYDIEKAMRALGPAFLQENFQRPVVDQMGQPMVNPMTGMPQMEFDQETAMQTVNEVLNDTDLGRYDVAVGENISSDTVRLGQYLELRDMAEAGFPVPPDVLLEASNVPDHQKKRIMSAIQAQQASGQPPAAPKSRRGKR